MYSGLDIGTTGSKIVIFDERGNEVYSVYKPYDSIHKGDIHELNPLEFIDAIKYLVQDAFSKYPNVKGMGIDSFGEAFVLLDKNDQPLTNIILSSDPRGQEELLSLLSKVDEETIKDITGLKPSVTYSLAKIMWIKNHQPQVFKEVDKILLVEDYVIYFLTRNRYIDYSLATRTMAFDINNLSWSKKILNACDINSDLFSSPVSLGYNCGPINKVLQNELGINTNVNIFTAGHDQVAVAIGSRVIDEKVGTDGAGTVECITPVFKDLSNKKVLIDNNYAIVPFLNNTYVTYAFNFTSGSLISWYTKQILNRNDGTVFIELESNFKNKPSDLLVLPHFAGAATPYMDHSSKGTIIGLSISHTASDIYQGILEGIAYEMKLNLNILKRGNVDIKYLNASGGGSNSYKWLQMKANIYNVPINKINGKECGARGGAILASVAFKEYQNINEAIKSFVKIEKTFIPNKDMNLLYEKSFKKYEKLYTASKEVLRNE